MISGGQTGVDRGALDAALNKGLACGEHYPEDRRAEDGLIDDKYPLTPLKGAGYRKRTRQNVIDSDATVIIYHTFIVPKSGTELTLETCISQNKPYLLIDMNVFSVEIASDYILDFIKKYQIDRLNFGGPRGSGVPSIQAFTQMVVERAIEKWVD
ncbi:putative molybdenum carrier protein [Moraxella bovis]|uniref:putative molybdenum carrier protein n=1 Tax=Moraxella bovis TaxID=476 RepID=UPI0022278396|nr:putative molybdenum carrier protein [Moraxella bovis]